ncbi:MAG: hypothetical protein ACP5HX_11300 [Thermoproteota archaeon]|jgi:hypothetical protein
MSSKTLFFHLTISKKHTNLHVVDFATNTCVTIRDAGVVPALQPLVDYIKKVGEKKKVKLNYVKLISKRISHRDFVSYKAFINSDEVAKLLPSQCFGEVRKIANLLA